MKPIVRKYDPKKHAHLPKWGAPIKTKVVDGGGLRHNQGKLRLDLIPTDVKEVLADILTWACTSREPAYPERNWERGMPWSNVVGSLERHLADIKMGRRLDPTGTGKRTSALLLCNAVFLCAYDIRGMHDLDDLEPFARAAAERGKRKTVAILKKAMKKPGRIELHHG